MNVAYNYDAAGRLTQVLQNGTLSASYEYDANDNRLSATSSAGTVSGTYDAQDRLLTYGSSTYTYTADGKLRTRSSAGQTTTYQYDEVGTLTGVTLPNGMSLTYQVDSDNRRVSKSINGVVVQRFLYEDGLRPIAEFDANNAVVSRFIYATGTNIPAYMVRAGVSYRIITDHLGSPRLVVNATNGQVVQRMDYDTFGQILQDTNPGFQPFAFAGGIYDGSTQLIRFGARDYVPEIGRWASQDPLGLTVGLNLYTYGSDDPVNHADPSGLWWDRYDVAIFFAEREIDALQFLAGCTDSLSFGLSNYDRNQLHTNYADPCSFSCQLGSWGLGVGRLAYAGLSKAVSLIPAVTGRQALAARNLLKRVFRGPFFWLPYGIKNYEKMLANPKYGTDAAIKAAAGRTNKYFNRDAAELTAGATVNAAINPCPCSH